MAQENMPNGIITGEITPILTCKCLEPKQYHLVFDGGFNEKYAIEYCQKCFDQEDKEFMISMELIQ